MAMTKSFTLQEEELSCPICFEDFEANNESRHPKLLTCLHTFCSSCIETISKHDGTLQCSICRAKHNVYHRDEQILDNYLIIDYLRLKQEADDEKLANQLGQEYNESVQMLQDQQERDAQLAREEEEKAEADRVRLEAERIIEEHKRRDRLKQEMEEEAQRHQEAELQRRRQEEEVLQRQMEEEEMLLRQRQEEEDSNKGEEEKENAEESLLFSDAEDGHRFSKEACKLFVGGLNPQLSFEEIDSYFFTFGSVVKFEFPYDYYKNQRKGFCFVTFNREKVVEKLLMNPIHFIKGCRVELKRAVPKHMQMKFANNINIPLQNRNQNY